MKMNTRYILSLSLVLILLATAFAWSAAGDEEAVRKVVDDHMSSLQKTLRMLSTKNLAKNCGDLKNAGKDMGEVGKRIEDALKTLNNEPIDLDIKSYAIKDVSVEGNTAYVRVTETRRIGLKEGAVPGLDMGYKTVNETFVLSKVNNQWKIDALNTLHITSIADITSPGGLMEIVNDMGLGRLALLMEDKNMSYFIQPIIQSVMQKVGSKIVLPQTGSQPTPPVAQPTAAPQTAPEARPTIARTAEPKVAYTPVTGPSPAVTAAAQAAPVNEKARRNMDMCVTNICQLGTMIQLYARDHQGRYPETLAQLQPDYLKSFPVCPTTGKDTYSIGYIMSTNPNRFTLYCAGHNHADAGLPFGYPQFTSERGLVTMP